MSLEYRSDEVDEELPAAPGDAVRPPAPLYTIILTVALGVVFLAQLGTGFETSTLATGFDKSAFRNGDYWRILTGATVHGSVVHILMNGYALYSFGRISEILAGRAHIAIVFFLAGIGGGLLSLIFLPDGRSVGASGAILGIVGYLAVYAFKRRQFISPEFRKNLLVNIGFILIFGLALYQQIDNFAHIGGLATGAVYGLLQIPSDEYVDPRATTAKADLAGLLALGAILATCVFSVILMLRLA